MSGPIRCLLAAIVSYALVQSFACSDSYSSRAERTAEEFAYVKDPMTGLCFAMFGVGTTMFSFSQVPCTPAVEKAIAGRQCAAPNVSEDRSP